MITCGELAKGFGAQLLDENDTLEKISNLQVYDVSNNSKKVKHKNIFFVVNEKALCYLDEVMQTSPRLLIVNLNLKNHEIVQKHLKNLEYKIVFCQDINIRKLYAALVVRFYNLHDLDLRIVAITGTNGKTSGTFFYKQLCNFAGLKSCSIGTIGIYSDDAIKYEESSLTSPDIADLCKIIYEKARNGIFDFAIEASSHGLSQHRLDGIPLEAVAFTNFTQDHLDYHGTMEEYWKAKNRLFSELISCDKTIIINNDDEKAFEIKKVCRDRGIQYVTYGVKNESDVQILSYNLTQDYKYSVEMRIFERCYFFEISVLGDFQLYNLATAVALFRCVHPEKIELLFFKDGGGEMKNLKAPPGRMETIVLNNKINTLVVIDYAHTPDALEKLLISSKKLLKNDEKLLLVFGCGGNRDVKKRPMMGQMAEKYADFIILTDDNPRDEEPNDIRNDILKGVVNTDKVVQIADRQFAIEKAIQLEYKIVIIAGKGHENKQIFSNVAVDFSDISVVELINQKLI